MNYEEKYKQALERAKKVHNGELTISPDEVNNFNVYEYIFPELKESEDERIRKDIVEYLKSQGALKRWDFNTWIAWLEKQGEQKFIDKIEPKFKVGDWITNGYYTWKVTDIKPLDYILQSPNGDVVDDTISYVDENLYLWTIQDAKDGDVLADEKPFIFRGFGDREHQNNPTAYCGITTSGTFILSTENEWWTADDFYPATKEQRDFLFQKMHEAGYEWDAEKKELRKVEQKLSWSEEDEKMVDDIIEAIDTQYAVSDYNEMVSWLKSLKPKKHWKPSEEQISMLLAVLNDPNNITAESVHIALKSLYNDLKKL